MNPILVIFMLLNLTFSTIGDVCAKLWGTTNSQSWFYLGFAINTLTVLTFMTLIRIGGLAITTAVVLLLTVSINVVLGYFIFAERIEPTQWFGIGLGLIALCLILNVFRV